MREMSAVVTTISMNLALRRVASDFWSRKSMLIWVSPVTVARLELEGVEVSILVRFSVTMLR